MPPEQYRVKSENHALKIASATTSLTQAILAAEQHVGGKASRAEFEHEKGKAGFKVVRLLNADRTPRRRSGRRN